LILLLTILIETWMLQFPLVNQEFPELQHFTRIMLKLKPAYTFMIESSGKWHRINRTAQVCSKTFSLNQRDRNIQKSKESDRTLEHK